MSKDVYILGVSMSRHDRAACLLRNGTVVAAIGEERLDRRKRSIGKYEHQPRNIVLPPLRAITYVLQAGGVTLQDLALVVCGRSMVACRDTLLQYLPVDPARVIEPALPGHHLAHAYSAYGTCPFDEPAILVIDEQGQHLPDGRFEKATWFKASAGPLETTAAFFGSDQDISLGMFYNVFAMLTSLSEASAPAAGKLMGLAPYGRAHPEWPELITLDEKSGDTHIPLQRLNDFFGGIGLTVRLGYEDTQPRDIADLARYISVHWSEPLAADLAYKAQDELEKAVLHISRALKKSTKATTLAYAGGVALNCTTNSRLLETGWSDVFVHPAATDDGNAIGLAYYGWIEVLGKPQRAQPRFNPLTGMTYPAETAAAALESYGLQGYARSVSAADEGAQRLARGELVCWVQGGSEWGPRALGARSILANPLLAGITRRINSTVKFREPFRPFAISSLPAALPGLVECAHLPESLAAYMLSTGSVKDSRLDEVKHVDSSLRFQVVDPSLQPEFAALIEKFESQTGLGAVLNTSFNTLGEPLVETPEDAVRQFLLSQADALIIGSCVLARADIPAAELARARKTAFARSTLDPLQAALGLEAAGYPDQALALLDELDYQSHDPRWDGPAAVLGYHGLLMRAALRAGQTQKAHEHAHVILDWSGLPVEAIRAAGVIAANPYESNHTLLGKMMGFIGSQGGGWKFVREMYQQEQVLADPSGSAKS